MPKTYKNGVVLAFSLDELGRIEDLDRLPSEITKFVVKGLGRTCVRGQVPYIQIKGIENQDMPGFEDGVAVNCQTLCNRAMQVGCPLRNLGEMVMESVDELTAAYGSTA